MKEPIKDERFLTGKHRWQPPDYEWLHNQYVTLKKPADQIAREVGADGSTVRGWLLRVKIHVRSTREASKLRSSDVEKRPPRGSRSPYWGGDFVGESAFRYRGRKVIEQAGVPKICEWCSKSDVRIQVNHRDHDFSNNDLLNLQYLCSRCHRLETILWNMYDENLIDLNVQGDQIVLEEDELTIGFLKVSTQLGDLT